MKRSLTVLALAFALAGTLTACSNRDPNPANSGGTTSGGTTSGSASTGQVSRRYGGQSIYNGRSYYSDGQYAAGGNGRVYDNARSSVSRDLSWDALRELGGLTVYDRTSLTDEAEIISRIGGAEIGATNKTPLTPNAPLLTLPTG